MSDLSRISRRTLLMAGGALALGGRTALAAGSNVLYQGRTIVTGQRPETRIPGMKLCLAQALVRVSGDPRLAGHPRIATDQQTPEAAVKHYAYRDLYAFRPIKDEQGTRDRPYEMTVDYDPAKIDAMLAGMGSKPWLAERPRLVMFIAVKHIASTFILTSMVDAGDLMRESFADASWRYAMEVVIPSDTVLSKAGITFDNLAGLPLDRLESLVDHKVGQIPLAGTLSWSRELLAWTAEWKLPALGREHRWAIAGVNFDAAFRNAVGGAAQILSGNGDTA